RFLSGGEADLLLDCSPLPHIFPLTAQTPMEQQVLRTTYSKSPQSMSDQLQAPDVALQHCRIVNNAALCGGLSAAAQRSADMCAQTVEQTSIATTTPRLKSSVWGNKRIGCDAALMP